MFNCLVEAAVQEGYAKCGCYPGYLILSNETCHGASLNCFRQVFDYLGTEYCFTPGFFIFAYFITLQENIEKSMTRGRGRRAWRLVTTRPSA